MGRKDQNYTCHSDVPKVLQRHSFYGIPLDDDQLVFLNAIWNPKNLIVFCNAKAGTGKTTIATGAAKLLYDYKITPGGIVYAVSPYGEQRQGYLKGDLKEKSEPYFTPFFQALMEVGGNPLTDLRDNNTNSKNGTGYIDCMTHTYTRGINLKEQAVIIDEAQNYTYEELKKILTRCADSCKVIVIGHTGQKDIPRPHLSGFAPYMKWYANEPYCQICTLTVNYRGILSTHADDFDITKVEGE